MKSAHYYTGNHRDADYVHHAYTCLARLGADGWPEKYPLPLFGANPEYTEHQRDPKIIARPEGESRTRPLADGLSHLRIFVDRSSVEIFVNDGDAVFTSRVFPKEDEHFMHLKTGDAFLRLWTLKPAVKEQFLI